MTQKEQLLEIIKQRAQTDLTLNELYDSVKEDIDNPQTIEKLVEILTMFD